MVQNKRSSRGPRRKASAVQGHSPSNSSPHDSRQLPNRRASATSRKRRNDKHDNTDAKSDLQRNPSKRIKTSAKHTVAKKEIVSGLNGLTTSSGIVKPIDALPVINDPPTQVLTLLVFGNGDNGELGLGPKCTEALRPRVNPYFDPCDSSKFHVVQLACGGMHTVGLTVDNKIVTWGVNDNHALGRDTAWNGRLRDIDVDSDDDAELNPPGSTPTEVSADHFPANTRFVQVAAGDSCSFVLTDTGLVYGWGTFRDPDGKEGFGYNTNGTLVEKQERPVLVQGLKKITQITCGNNHALALDAAGNIWAWGSGSQNQFGVRLFGRHQESLRPRQVRVCRNKAKYIATGQYHAFAIDRNDDVWAWGLNSYGEAGYAETAGGDCALLPYPMKIHDLCQRGITVLDGGHHHSAAVTDDGQCLVWGRLDAGQLGINFTAEQLQDTSLIRHDERGKPRICLRPTVVPNIGKTAHVACGTEYTIFVDTDGHAYASGFGSTGQLGFGSEEAADVARSIEGKQLKNRRVNWAGAGGQFSMTTAP